MSETFFPPGTMIGILGGGQLARMLCMEARRMGYSTLVWTGGLEAPASALCDEVIAESFDDSSALEHFIQRADVATVEFENIPMNVLEAVEKNMLLRPSAHAVSTCANRESEKKFLRENRIPCAPFWIISSEEELRTAMNELRGPGVMKTSAYGYDGKGQRKLTGEEDPSKVWQEFTQSCGDIENPRAVLEGFIHFEKELSVMIVRGADGTTACYDAVENRHRHHILDLTIAPASVPPFVRLEAKNIAKKIVDSLNYVGIMGVEFFLTTDQRLLVNETAPRPHNSGHHTIDSCVTSQFGQQLRAVCGLPLGGTNLVSAAVMLNLLGDMWPDTEVNPDWTPVLEETSAALHLYGKRRAMGRRKMGHVTIIGENSLDKAQRIKSKLLESGREM